MRQNHDAFWLFSFENSTYSFDIIESISSETKVGFKKDGIYN